MKSRKLDNVVQYIWRTNNDCGMYITKKKKKQRPWNGIGKGIDD